MYWLDRLFTFVLEHTYMWCLFLVLLQNLVFLFAFIVRTAYVGEVYGVRHCIFQVIRTITSVWILCGEWALSFECHVKVHILRNYPWINDAYLYGVVNSSGDSGLPKFHAVTCMYFVLVYYDIFFIVLRKISVCHVKGNTWDRYMKYDLT